jgi:hypothetical protein
MDSPFTWKEACVIQKIVEFGTAISPRKREKLKELTDDENIHAIEKKIFNKVNKCLNDYRRKG